jgi:hypothetical protein
MMEKRRLSQKALQRLVNNIEVERAVGSPQHAADIEVLLQWYSEAANVKLPEVNWEYGTDEDEE